VPLVQVCTQNGCADVVRGSGMGRGRLYCCGAPKRGVALKVMLICRGRWEHTCTHFGCAGVSRGRAGCNGKREESDIDLSGPGGHNDTQYGCTAACRGGYSDQTWRPAPFSIRSARRRFRAPKMGARAEGRGELKSGLSRGRGVAPRAENTEPGVAPGCPWSRFAPKLGARDLVCLRWEGVRNSPTLIRRGAVCRPPSCP